MATEKNSESTSDAPKTKRQRKHQNRVAIHDELFTRLKQYATEQKKPMNQVVAEALESFFAQ